MQNSNERDENIRATMAGLDAGGMAAIDEFLVLLGVQLGQAVDGEPGMLAVDATFPEDLPWIALAAIGDAFNALDQSERRYDAGYDTGDWWTAWYRELARRVQVLGGDDVAHRRWQTGFEARVADLADLFMVADASVRLSMLPSLFAVSVFEAVPGCDDFDVASFARHAAQIAAARGRAEQDHHRGEEPPDPAAQRAAETLLEELATWPDDVPVLRAVDHVDRWVGTWHQRVEVHPDLIDPAGWGPGCFATVTTFVVKDATDPAAAVRVVNAFNAAGGGSAAIYDPDARTIALRYHTWVQAGDLATRTWAVTAKQYAVAATRAETMAAAVGGTVAASAHPTAGPESVPEHLRVTFPRQQRWWGPGDEQEWAELADRLRDGVADITAVTSGPDGLAADIDSGGRTARLTVSGADIDPVSADGTALHAELGGGFTFRLQLAGHAPSLDELNQANANGIGGDLFQLGGWYRDRDDSVGLCWFSPNGMELGTDWLAAYAAELVDVFRRDDIPD